MDRPLVNENHLKQFIEKTYKCEGLDLQA